MADRETLAQNAMVAICAAVAMGYDDQFEVWAAVMTEVLADVGDVPLAVAGLHVAALNFAAAPHDSLTVTRLRYVVRDYYANAAGARLDFWRAAKQAQR